MAELDQGNNPAFVVIRVILHLYFLLALIPPPLFPSLTSCFSSSCLPIQYSFPLYFFLFVRHLCNQFSVCLLFLSFALVLVKLTCRYSQFLSTSFSFATECKILLILAFVNWPQQGSYSSNTQRFF